VSELAASVDSPDDFDRRLIEYIRLENERRFEQFPLQALTWLAVAPAWPLRLAEKGFPVAEEIIGTDESVKTMLARSVVENFSESGKASGVFGGTNYWMNQSQRSFVINRVIEKNDRGLDYVRGELYNAGVAMERAADERLPLSPPLLRWIELAKSVNDEDRMVRLIGDKVDKALNNAVASNLSGAPEALRWIEAAEPLAIMFKGPLEVAVTRAGRKLELFHRRVYDARFLENYYLREAQDQAFKELIDGPDDLWALHYVGLGGTGKTMLMRHISSQLAPAREYNLAVARVDFDHLNPDYPAIRPGLLLTGLAEELRAYGDQFTSNSFKDFDRATLTLHEKIKGEASFGSASGVTLGDRLFVEVLEHFAAELNNLWANGKRPLLILDTCEELAKIRADGTQSDSVRVTFEILEYLHERAPHLRVVFSGRRPLAWSGHGWVFSTQDVQANKDVLLADHREYLRLHEIRGFTEEEALALLEGFKKNDHTVDPQLFDAILSQSNSSDQTFDSRFEFTDTATSVDTDPRYNPFDLDMYASWSCEDETLDKKKLEKGVHYYVRERIIGRAHDLVKKYLPHLTLLGRFDREIMRDLIVSSGDQFDILFPELIDQEWIDVDRGGVQTATVWAMDSVMRKRLLNYYADAEHSNLISANTRVGEFLYNITLNREWKDLTSAYFEAALHTLSPNKVKAAEWWNQVEAKLAKTGEWQWAMSLTESLLAEGGPVARADITAGMKPEQESILRPAVLATRAAALTHLKPLEAKNLWEEVLGKADRHPTEEGALKLKFRATAGLIASLRLPEYQALAPGPLGHYLNTIEAMLPELAFSDPQNVASLIAMLEGLAELFEELIADSEVGVDWSWLFEALSIIIPKAFDRLHAKDDLARDLAVFADSLRGRFALTAVVRDHAADSIFKGVLAEIDSLEKVSAVQHWLDWQRPDDLHSRIRLQYIRAMYPAYLDAESALKQVNKLPAELTTLDADRLASAVLSVRSYIKVPPEIENFGEILEHSLSLQSISPACKAHRDVPPYFTTLLEAKAARGSIDEVVRLGLKIAKDAEASGDIRTQQALDRLMLRLAYRFRLRDERGLAIGGSIETSNRVEDIDLRFILAALDGAKSNLRLNTKEPNLNQWRYTVLAHIGFRTGEVTLDLQKMNFSTRERNLSFQTLLSALDEFGIDPASDANRKILITNFGFMSFETFSLFLDAIEAAPEMFPRPRSRKGAIFAACDAWRLGHATKPAEAVTLYVRSFALTWNEDPPGFHNAWSATEAPQLAIRIGKRRAAEIALEEGVLLALRSPRKAWVALGLAATAFTQSGDHAGTFMADTCLAMLNAKLQNGPALGRMLEQLQNDYLELASRVAGLPPWKNFLARIDGGEPVSAIQLTEFLDRLEGNSWRPWLVRFTGCLVRSREFSRPKALTKALREWIENNYSAQVNNVIAIPAEFDSSFLYGESASLEEHRTKRPWFRRLGEILSQYRTRLYVLIALTLAVVLFLGLMRGVRYLISIFSATVPGTCNTAILTFGLIALTILMPRFVRWCRALPLRLGSYIFRIDCEDPVIDPNRPLQSRNRVAIKTMSVNWGIAVPYRDSFVLGSSTSEGYLTLPTVLPEKFRQAQAKNSRWLNKYLVNVTLSLNEQIVAAPWEAVFGLAQMKDTGIEQNRWLFRRTMASSKSSRSGADPIAEPVQVLTWAPDPSQVDMARNSWRNERLPSSRFQHNAESPAQQIQKSQEEVHVLHLIGTPIEVTSGIRFEIGEAETRGSSRPDTRAGDDVSSSAYKRGFLVQAEELRSRFSTLHLCIVQGTVLPEETPRTSLQRFEAAKLRRFGADLSSSGIACVILLPPTTRDLSIELMSQITQTLSRRKSGIKDWMTTVRSIQETIAAKGHSDKDAALEMAFDVCIYMVDGFQFRTTAK
jgi:hypothetical protein